MTTIEQLAERIAALEARQRQLEEATSVATLNALRLDHVDLKQGLEALDARLTRMEDKIDGLTHASSEMLRILGELQRRESGGE